MLRVLGLVKAAKAWRVTRNRSTDIFDSVVNLVFLYYQIHFDIYAHFLANTLVLPHSYVCIIPTCGVVFTFDLGCL